MERVTLTLPDDLEADLEAYCRAQHVHQEEAVQRLLAEWLDTRAPDDAAE